MASIPSHVAAATAVAADASAARGVQSEKHACPTCDRVFKRAEHLRRHKRSHDEPVYTCPKCSKAFARSDILRRHEATHDARPVAATLNADGVTVRKRACHECARLRERCSKQEPCFRCESKALPCVYPSPSSRGASKGKKRRAASLAAGAGDWDGAGGSTPSTALPRPSAMSNETDGGSSPAVNLASVAASAALDEPAYSQRNEQAFGSHRNLPLNASYSASYAGQTDASFRFPATPFGNQHPNVASAATHPEPSPRPDHAAASAPAGWRSPSLSVSLNYSYVPADDVYAVDLLAQLTDMQLKSAQQGPALGSQHQAMGHVRPSSSMYATPRSGYRVRPPLDSDAHASAPSGLSASLHTPTESTPPAAQFGRPSLPSLVSHQALGGRSIGNDSQVVLRGGTPQRPLASVSYGTRGNDESVLAMPDVAHITWHSSRRDVTPNLMTRDTYDTVYHQFTTLCAAAGRGSSARGNINFPSYDQFQLFFHMYFLYFDPILPIFHRRLMDVNAFWPLALALGAIGCQYTETHEFSQCVGSLHEFLRRALTRESSATQSGKQAYSYQASRILSQLGMMYSGSPRLANHAREELVELVAAAKSNATAMQSPETTLSPGEGIGSDRGWEKALATEAKRRATYAIILLDCVAAYQSDNWKASFSVSEVYTPLPSDAVWTTTTCSEWAALSKDQIHMASISDATRLLGQGNLANPKVGEFARLVMLHGVALGKDRTFKPTLRPSWISPRNIDNSDPALLDEEPSQSAEWRDDALRCVDILNRDANSKIASAGGIEHPSVLHLYFSRVAILAPLESIRALASWLARPDENAPSGLRHEHSQGQISKSRRQVVEWAQRHERSARWAVLHSGRVFWHLRRYSRKAFCEPCVIFLATLTLWAYSTHVKRPSGLPPSHRTRASRHGAHDVAFPGDSDAEPPFIRLDRPNDDELAHLFVSNGRSAAIKAYVSGVGDIYSARGPAKILREGRKILSAVSIAWGRHNEYASVLERLAEVAARDARVST